MHEKIDPEEAEEDSEKKPKSEEPEGPLAPCDESQNSDDPLTPRAESQPSRDPLQQSGESPGPEQRASGQSFGKFSAGTRDLQDDDESEKHLTFRDKVGKVLENSITQTVSGVLVMLTVLLICMDTNARAQGSTASQWEDIAMFVCYIAYVLEFSAGLFVQGKEAVHDYWNYIDALVISSSAVEYALSFFKAGSGLSLLRLLRILRLLRLGKLMRALKLLGRVSWLKEVYVLCMMMASCMRTLLWVLALCFFTMTIWSVLAVELLNEVVVEMAENDPELWGGCSRCPRSFASIWESNWTLFQTIVAGDSWGMMALPVIEMHPWSAPIFIGAFSSILFGLLNLISAVVIDTFAERRARDVSSLASEMEYEEVQEKKVLGRIFDQIDEDRSGALSIDELRVGAVKVREFRHYLRVLDIDDHDLGELFGMIDYDGSGEVDPEEFIEALYRMKHTDPKTATRFVKHIVATLVDKQKVLDERLDGVQESVLERLTKVEDRLISDLEGASQNQVQNLLQDHAKNIDETINKAIERAATVALDAGLESAVSKAISAIRKVVTTSSNRTAVINDRVNQLCRSGSHSELSDCTFGRQCTPLLQEPFTFSRQVSKEFSRQASKESSSNQKGNPSTSSFHSPPQPKVAKAVALLSHVDDGTAGGAAKIIKLGETIPADLKCVGSEMVHENKTMTSAVPLAEETPVGDASISVKSCGSTPTNTDFKSAMMMGPKGPQGTPSEKFAAKRASVAQKPPKQSVPTAGKQQLSTKL